MQITLDQLKEIAKAGYEDEAYIEIIDRSTMNIDNSYRYSLHHEYYEFVMNYAPKIGYVMFYPNDHFNALAAIRKMEELGLIEKYRSGDSRFD